MEKNDSNSDLIICLIIGFMFLSELIWTFSIDFVDNFYTSIWYIPFTIISGLLSALIPIILAFVVSNKSKKIFCLVIGLIFLVMSLYELLNHLILSRLNNNLMNFS